MTKVLITGGCGFLGAHVVEHIIKQTDWHIAIFDKLNYAAMGYDRIRDINCFDNTRITRYSVDFSQPISVGIVKEVGDVDYILHLGAETHVDRSIEDPGPFVIANVVGTMNILDYARGMKSLRKMIYFGTDEVFGPAPEGVFYKEWDRYNSSNPYAAAKAGGEELCLAYGNTYKLPIVITHTMNIGGERQHYEKFIPLVIRKVFLGETVTIHSDPTRTKSGSRFYIHGRNVADGLLFLLENGKLQDKYNIVGEREITNLELAQMVAGYVGKELKYEMVNFHESRPGHDLRYALDGTKMRDMGWENPVKIEEWLKKTVTWSLKKGNKRWLNL